MATELRIIVADKAGGVRQLAEIGGWTLLDDPKSFGELDTLDDGTLGNGIGRLFVTNDGFAALATREA